jgi:signal transduction histidine kinase
MSDKVNKATYSFADDSSLEMKMMYRFLFIVGVMCTIYSIYDLWVGQYIFFILNTLVVLVCIIVNYHIRYKNQYRYVTLPSIIFIFLMNSIGFFVINGFYGSSVVSFMILLFTVALLFPLRLCLIVSVSFGVVIGLLFYLQSNHSYLVNYIPPSYLRLNLVMDFVANAILLISMAGIIRNEYTQERKLIIEQKSLLEKQNSQIDQQNKEILSFNDGMYYLNQQLGKLVEERTKQLEEQNIKLINYAFYNAHKVRSPLARILGLIHLLQMEENIDETAKRFYLENIVRNIAELEQVIKNIPQKGEKSIKNS